MNGLTKVLQAIPYSVLVPIAILMALMPFFPLPHLVEKLSMLFRGTLKRPLDIFDLIFHSVPLIILLLKFLTDKRG
jgi:hypothetical protein